MYKFYIAVVCDLILTVLQTYIPYGYYIKVIMPYHVPSGTDSGDDWWLFGFYWCTFLGLCVSPVVVLLCSLCNLNQHWLDILNGCGIWLLVSICISAGSLVSFILYPIYLMISPLLGISATNIMFYVMCFCGCSCIISLVAWIAFIPISLSYVIKYRLLKLDSTSAEKKPLLPN